MKSLTLSHSRLGWLPAIVIAFTALLPILSHYLNDASLWESLPAPISKQLIYQPLTLGVAWVFLVLLCKARPEVLKTYFKKGQLNAAVTPAPMVGINPKKGQTWKYVGWNFTIVISVVTAAVIYLSTPKINYQQLLLHLPIAVGFALINSFVEEIITRLGVVVSLKDKIPDSSIAIFSGLLFGTVHYWGTPGGFGGVLLAGFLGWLLAKSILETKGIFWAWFIHFCQDVIIISALLSST
jgi:membrane protease YdiL (CAAX protease family)